MQLMTITISIDEDRDWTDAQLEELIELWEDRLDYIMLEYDLQQETSKAKLSQDVKVHLNY